MISVAIPAYKPEFLSIAIKSVLGQSFTDFELIILNDASPYDIKSIVSEFSDNRIKYFENAVNLGRTNLVATWNKCLDLARGELFVLFSDDDVYHTDFLLEMNKLSAAYPNIDIFHCRVNKIDEQGNIIGITPSCPDYETAINFVWHTMRGYRNLYVTEFLIRTNALKKIGGFHSLPLAWASDYVTWFKLSKNQGIVFTNQILSSWRSSNFNISNVGNTVLRLEALDQYKDWLITYLKDLNINDLNEVIMIRECNLLLDSFIQSKKEYLLVQHLEKESSFFSVVKFFNFYSQYKLPLKKTLFLFLRSLFIKNRLNSGSK